MEKITLIQLVSEQTIPNILPILILKPYKVIFLYTPPMKSRIGWIQKAAEEHYKSFQSEKHEMPQMPSMRDTYNLTNKIISTLKTKDNTQIPILNFTCGTKLMSIGAYASALKNKIPSFYCNTETNCFESGNTATETEEELQLNNIKTDKLGINVKTMLLANGMEIAYGGREYRYYSRLADYLFYHEEDEEKTCMAIRGPNGFLPNGEMPKNKKKCLLLKENSLKIPVSVGDIAVSLGILKKTGTGEFLLNLNDKNHDSTPSTERQISNMQFILNFLSGGWLEAFVANKLFNCKKLTDIKWSLSLSVTDGATMEKDVLATDGIRLFYFSCKRGGGQKDRLMSHIHDIAADGNAMGGTFTKKYLVIFNPPVNIEALQKEANQFKVKIITADDFKTEKYLEML